MPLTITTSNDGITVTGGGIEESFHASPSGNGVELTAAEAERLSRTLLRLAGDDAPPVVEAPPAQAAAPEPVQPVAQPVVTPQAEPPADPPKDE